MKLVRFQNPVLAPWSAFGRLADLRDEIDRFFDPSLGEAGRMSSLIGEWVPAIELVETKESVVVKAELPGMKKEDIEVTIHDGMLHIAGERKSEKQVGETDHYRSERFFGRFQRSITLPDPVASDKVRADYKDGILTVTLPKTEEAKPKQINVNVA